MPARGNVRIRVALGRRIDYLECETKNGRFREETIVPLMDSVAE
jgi:hypothetical protein